MSLSELQPFPIFEIRKDGVIHHSAEDFSRLIEEQCRHLQATKDESHIVFLKERSVPNLAMIYACIQIGKPFAFVTTEDDLWDYHSITTAVEIERRAKDVEDVARPFREKNQFCYAIRTSGSTGPPKVIFVPNKAIWANIDDFRTRFNVTQNDRVLFSTSVLFDPSMVEILLCYLSGATMIMVTDEIRCSPHLLSKVIEEFKPTFVQFTPSLFRMFNFTERNRQMMNSIRIMLLGGEKFPLAFVNQHRASHYPNARVFDVYGVTEVSCWSTVFEVKPETTVIPLGEPIKDTFIRCSEGKLIIEGPRICVENTDDGGYETGDWVVNTEHGYVLQGRTDNLIKYKGMKLCLEQMADEMMCHVEEVEYARFLFWKKKHLVLFAKFHHTSKPVSEVKKLIKAHFHQFAVTIIKIDKFPLTNNKKIDNMALEKVLEKVYTRKWRVEQFWEILKRHGIREGMTDAILVDYGIKSLTAAELAILLGNEAEIREILAETTTAGFLFEKYLQQEETFSKRTAKDVKKKIDVDIEEFTCPQPIWEYDMKKCIDGNALIVKYQDDFHVIMASHSGMILNINHTKNTVIWQKTIEGVRFEAGPGFAEGRIYVGSYQGHLYVLDFLNGEQLDHLFFEKSSIRGPVKGVEGDVVFITYCEEAKDENSGQIHVFRYDTSELLSYPIAGGSPTSVLIEKGDNAHQILATTIKGTVEFLTCDKLPFKLSHKNRLQVGKAIFSPPIKDPKNEYLVVTTADGIIVKFKDTIEKSVNLEEAFFAPIEVVIKKDRTIYLAVSQKGNVFFLDQDLVISRIISFPGCSFVKPLIYSTNEVTLMSTDARLLMIDRKNFWKSKIPRCRAVKLGNREIFAKPMFLNGDLIVGCRDDYARAFHYHELSKIS